jgi:flagellar hook-basal body protein
VEETIFPYIPLPLYPESGKEYTFSLTVSDDLGETHTATIKGTGESTRLLKKTLNGADKSYFQKAFYELGWVSSNEDTAWAELVSGAGGTWAAVEAVLINQDFFNDIAASAGAPAIFYSGDPQANFTSLMTCADKMAVLDALFNKAGVADNFTILLQKNGIQNGIEKLEEKLGGVRILSERLYLSAYNHRALFIDLWDFLSETSTETALATILGDASRERYSTSFAEIDAIVRSSQQGKSLFDLLKEHGLLQALMTNPNYRFMQYGEELLRRVLDEGSLDSLYNDTWTLAVEDVEGGTPLLSGGTLEVTANGDIQYDLDLPPTLHVTWDNEEGQEIPLDTTLLKTSAIIDTVSNRGTTGIKLMEQKMEGENPDSGVLVHVTDAKKGVYTLDLIFDHFWKKLHVRKYYYSDPDFQIDEEANSADPGGTLHFSGYLSDCSISLCPDDPEGDYIDADGRLIQLLGKPIKLNIIANGRKIQIGFDLTQFRIDEADRSRITLYPIISSTGDTPSTSESQSVQFHTLLPDPTILDSYTEPLIIRDSYGVAHDIVVQFLYEGGSWKASIADPGGAREFSFGNEGVVDLSESTEAILTATWDNHATSNITFVFGERIIEERAVSSIGDLEDTETANSLSGGVTSSQEEDEVLDMTQWVLTDQGLIEITYANGVTKSLYQVPLLNCADPVRLTEKAGIFLSNRASGEFQATSPGAAGLGTIQTSALEASTVDLAQELSRMIKAQHAYAANTHVLSTIDQMLQELERV